MRRNMLASVDGDSRRPAAEARLANERGRFAARAQLDPVRALAEVDATLALMRSAWLEIAPDLPLPPDHRQALADHWRRVPLLRDAGPLD